MLFYNVTTTEATKNFTPCLFMVLPTGIFVYTESDGLFKHPTFTSKSLKAHLDNLEKEGFCIKTAKF